MQEKYKKKAFRFKNIQKNLVKHISTLEKRLLEFEEMKSKYLTLEESHVEICAMLESEKKVCLELESQLLEKNPNSKSGEDLLEDLEVKSCIIEDQQEEINVLNGEIEKQEDVVKEKNLEILKLRREIETLSSRNQEKLSNPRVRTIVDGEKTRRKTLRANEVLHELEFPDDEVEGNKKEVTIPIEDDFIEEIIVQENDESLQEKPLPSISALTREAIEEKQQKSVSGNLEIKIRRSLEEVEELKKKHKEEFSILSVHHQETLVLKEKRHQETLELKEKQHMEEIRRKDIELATLQKQLLQARDERVMSQLKIEKVKEIQLQQQKVMASIIEKEKNQLSRTHKKVFKRGILTLKEIQKQIVDENSDLKKSNFVLIKRLNEVKEKEGNIRYMNISLSEKEEQVKSLRESMKKQDLLLRHENSGFLRKQGGKIKTLKWRWFVFHRDGFSYFKEKADKKSLADVVKRKGKEFKILKNVEKDNDLAFGIVSPENRIYKCEAPSASEKTRWLIYLEEWENMINEKTT